MPIESLEIEKNENRRQVDFVNFLTTVRINDDVVDVKRPRSFKIFIQVEKTKIDQSRSKLTIVVVKIFVQNCSNMTVKNRRQKKSNFEISSKLGT